MCCRDYPEVRIHCNAAQPVKSDISAELLISLANIFIEWSEANGRINYRQN